ncbi:MAG: hypothetical protein OXI80_20125 [Caldilineaceae bacterium]|nr:hypothetical protein [Caldilineaceae bacterium]
MTKKECYRASALASAWRGRGQPEVVGDGLEEGLGGVARWVAGTRFPMMRV